jgi:hypothetical protein
MVNDLATEATTVQSRFPYAIVAFMAILPGPALAERQRETITELLAQRNEVNDPPYMAEAISLVIWDPHTGQIVDDNPQQNSVLRIERFSEKVSSAYAIRYKGLPPHDR